MRPCSAKPFDVHLMIAPADPFIEAFAEAGADTITVHAEAGPHVHRTLQTIRALGKRAGLAINPATPDERRRLPARRRRPRARHDGQSRASAAKPSCPAMLPKIERRPRHARRPAGRHRGGWRHHAETAPLVVRAGANALVAGSAVFAGGPDAYAAKYRGDPRLGRVRHRRVSRSVRSSLSIP